MLPEDKYFRTLTKDELWQRYCGFLNLSVDEFMKIQKELLLDEIERIGDSVLGKKIMGDQKPQSVEDFRRLVPLTTYEDYEPYLSERQEDALAIKPYFWCHSAGRGGYFKWLPYSWEFLETLGRRMLSGFIIGSASKIGEVNISPGLRFFAMAPPGTYAGSSVFNTFTTQLFSCRVMPPPEMVGEMSFEERIQKGFQMATRDGVDIIAGIASVLVRMGEALESQTKSMRLSRSMLHPKIVLRLLLAWLRSKKEKRAILPKDIWPTKAIMTGGVDVFIYRNELKRYWGSKPYEFYGCAESLLLALQGWDREDMVFLPDTVFFEFIPYEEQLKSEEDKDYQPPTVLLNEVKEGEAYEVVITQLYGMPLLRYRTRDIIKVTALRDTKADVNLPHVVFQHRVDEAINIGGMAWLDEKMIWQAIANTGIKYADWSACKEYDRNQSFLRIYLELKEKREAAEIEALIDKQLKIVDTDYKDIDFYLGLQPVRVAVLSPGTFQRYIEEKRKEGVDLARLKPRHVNPPEAAIKRLLELSEVTSEA